MHEIAHAAKPGARVVYADNDPVVVTHARALLADSLTVAAVNGDLREPDHLLGLPEVKTFIDWDEPVAVLMVAVLHFLEDRENPWAAVDAFKDRMAPGSYLVLSHVTGDDTPADLVRQASEVYLMRPRPGWRARGRKLHGSSMAWTWSLPAWPTRPHGAGPILNANPARSCSTRA